MKPRHLLTSMLLLVACIPAPPPVSLLTTSDGFDTDFSGTSPWDAGIGSDALPTTIGDVETTGIGSSSGEPATTGAATGPEPTTTDPTVDPTVSPSSSTGDGLETGTEESGDPSLPSFGPAEPFGDDIRETDLVGVWTKPWEPAGVADVSITIAADGAFTWVETSADCSTTNTASGQLWVAGTQLIFHVDVWDKRDPWLVDDIIGGSLERPFRMHLGYSPMGGYLGLNGGTSLTHQGNWAGRTYDRQQAGLGAGGDWIAEAELWALISGEVEPRLVLRDRFAADLQGSGSARVSVDRSIWYPSDRPVWESVALADGSWSDETPGAVVGAAGVIGVRHAYDAVHMLSFEPDRSFKLGVVSDCG